MKTFNDGNARVFRLHLTIGMVRLVQAELGMDLRRPDNPQSTAQDAKPTLVARLMSDPFEFLDLLKVLVRGQAEEHSITLDEWADALEPTVIGEAREAFFEEWADFFHGLKTPHVADLIQEERTFQKKLAEHLLSKAKQIDLDAVVSGSTSSEKSPSTTLPSGSGATPTT